MGLTLPNPKAELLQIKKQFSCNLVYLMMRESTTCRMLCENLNISAQTLTYWRTGKRLPSIVHLQGLSRMFGASMEDMIGPMKIEP